MAIIDTFIMKGLEGLTDILLDAYESAHLFCIVFSCVPGNMVSRLVIRNGFVML